MNFTQDKLKMALIAAAGAALTAFLQWFGFVPAPAPDPTPPPAIERGE